MPELSFGLLKYDFLHRKLAKPVTKDQPVSLGAYLLVWPRWGGLPTGAFSLGRGQPAEYSGEGLSLFFPLAPAHANMREPDGLETASRAWPGCGSLCEFLLSTPRTFPGLG